MHPTIALCMIVGNEAEHIIHCLNSALEAFDHLRLAFARGDTYRDETRELSAQWVIDNDKTAEYADYVNRHRMPHIDDFAAARNLSFDTHTDWLLWLDADDRLTPEVCRKIREVVNSVESDVNCIRAPYLVKDNGTVIMRERLIRNGKGVWKGAVHEICEVEGESIEVPEIKVYHTQHTPEKAQRSAARNLAIESKALEGLELLLFRKHADLMTLNRPLEALESGRLALAVLPLARCEERYYILINLGLLDDDNGQA